MRNCIRRQKTSYGKRLSDKKLDSIVPLSMPALKLRNEPEEFFTEPRKPPTKVTLPRVRLLERPDP